MNLHFSGWLAMENSCSEGGKCAWRRLLAMALQDLQFIIIEK